MNMKKLTEMSLTELWELFPIILKEHNLDYSCWYEQEKINIQNTLKGFDVFRINHIGSTYVPALIAKPIVDILLEFEKEYNKSDMIDSLTKDGWLVMAQDDKKGTIDLNKGYTLEGFAEKVYHLHIKPAGDWGELYFRDYLLAHDEVAREYEVLKLKLKERFEHDRDSYTEAKTDFISIHTQKARKELKNNYNPSYKNSKM